MKCPRPCGREPRSAKQPEPNPDTIQKFLLNPALILAIASAVLCLLLGGCCDPAETAPKNYHAADFVGRWDTVLPTGERWRLTLSADGRCGAVSLVTLGTSQPCTWRLEDDALHWSYRDPAAPGGVRREINPIIIKTVNKFMLQERLGMKSVFARHVDEAGRAQ